VIGIGAISYYLPQRRLPNALRAATLGVPAETLERRIGVTHISRKDEGQETSDLAVAATVKLFEHARLAPADVECLIVVTQNPDGRGLPQTSALVQHKLGLSRSCASFDIGLGCSGYVYGLSVIRSFMEGNGMRRGVLVTADPYSKVIDPADKRTSLLFGDGASATLLTDEPAWRIGRFDFGTDGSRADSLRVDPASGRLSMDGRAVLQFSMNVVPESLRRVIALNCLVPESIDRIVLHQGSRVVVENIGLALDMQDRTGFYIRDYGNTVSSSVPIVLADHLCASDRHVAIAGFGVGLSWASTVLSRTGCA